MILQIDDSTYYLEGDYQDISHGRILLSIERLPDGSHRLRERRNPIVLDTGKEYAEIKLEDGQRFSIADIPCRCFRENVEKPVAPKETPPRGTTVEEDRALIEELKKLKTYQPQASARG